MKKDKGGENGEGMYDTKIVLLTLQRYAQSAMTSSLSTC